MLVSTLFPLLTILSSAMASQFPIPPLPQTPDADMPGTYHPEVVDMPSIADVLNSQSRSTIFYDYLREIDSISKMVSTNHGNELTLLVPTNKAVIALPRKPCVDVHLLVLLRCH